MKKIIWALCLSVLGLSVLATSGAFAADKAMAKTTVKVTAPAATPAIAPVGTSASTPVGTMTPVTLSSSEPAAPVAAKAAVAAAPASAIDVASTVKFGNMEFSHMKLSRSGSTYDISLSIKNEGKGDDKISGGGSSWDSGDVVMVTKGKDGKEQESALSLPVVGGKTLELSKGDTWIRVKNVKEPKNPAFFPLSLYFRSSPNADLKISMKDTGGSGILDWFSK